MDRIQFRRDTSANWTTYNPVLMEGEVGYETDTKKRKIGDGTNTWNNLEYLAAENISQELGDSENMTVSQKAITINDYKKITTPLFFKNSELNRLFKEFYIEGLSSDVEYCLRTVRFNPSNDSYQINIGDSSKSIIEIFVPAGETYGKSISNGITAYVILQRTDEIIGNLLYQNVDTSIGALDKKVCVNLINSPSIKALIDNTSVLPETIYINPEEMLDGYYNSSTFEVGSIVDNGNLVYYENKGFLTFKSIKFIGLKGSKVVISGIGGGGSSRLYCVIRIDNNTVTHIAKANENTLSTPKEITLEYNSYVYISNVNSTIALSYIHSSILEYNNLRNEIKSSEDKLKENINLVTYAKPIFFKETQLDKYFKEFYIEGLNNDTTYVLRTLRYNPSNNSYQINIGDSTRSVIELFVPVETVFGYRQTGSITCYVVLQNSFIKEITKDLIIGNTNISVGTLNKETCTDLGNSPYIANKISETKYLTPPAFNGYALPKNPQTLKVLHVGNSFADQPISKLKLWLDALGIQNVTYGIVMRAGGTLQQHYNSIVYNEPYNEGSAFRLYKNVNGETTYTANVDPKDKSGSTTTSDQIKLSDCLQFTDWDVITFQQASWASGKWETIEPYLPTLIKYARYYCPNSGVKIGWQMTWAYAKGYTELSYYGNSQETMFNGIVQCAKNVANYYGIDLIVPNGVVVQNLRSVPTSFWGSNLNSIRGAETWTSETQAADFTDDGLHPNNIAEYCTSAAFIMVIYGACYNKSIRGVDAILGNIKGDYAKVARQCVLKAVGDRFNISKIDITNILE